TAEVPQLKTDRSDVSIIFNEKYVEELPILNRNFTNFELLSPGTQKLVGWSHAATENPQGSQQIFVNGQHFSGTAYELDGTDNQDPILGIIVINPNLDSVTETKMTLQNYDAEFGKAIAGVMTAQTRSGSNALHGSAFWFRRSDATQARDPFTQFQKDPVTNRFIPSTMWNQFGGSIGGAAIKDKLFFFGDYQGTRRKSGRTIKGTVPTDLARTSCLQLTGMCNLSDYLGVKGTGKVYNPATGDPLTGAGRTLFAGNLIPNSLISPQARSILALFPSPNAPGVVNNFVGSGFGPYNDNSYNTRVDYQASQRTHVFGRYSYAEFSLSGQPIFGKALGGEGFGEGGLAGSATTHNHSLASGFDYVVSPTLLTDFRFGYFKYHPESNKFDVGTSPATGFGIPGLNLGDPVTSGLPGFFMDPSGDFQTLSHFGEALNIRRCNCPLVESEQQFKFVNNWTKISGNHQFKFWGDVRYAMNLRTPSDANRAGQLTFHHLGTSGGSSGGDGGLDFATFLLGDATFLERYVNSAGTLGAAERQKRFFFYGQDTWRITPKLTFNYGLRWELYYPESVNGKGKGGFANIEQGLIRVAGFGPYGTNGNIDMTYKAFAPRLGVAYQLTPKTVVRMGYGRSFDIGVFGSLFGHTVTQNLPVLVNQNVTAQNNVDQNATNDRIPAFTLASGPPAFVFPPIPANGTLPLQGPLGNVNPKVRPTFMRLPTLDAWNVTVQRQITNSVAGEIAYVANKGTHIFAGNGPSYNVNQASLVGFGVIPQAQRRPLFNRFTYPGFTDSSGNTLMCCSSDITYLGNDASNNYNALQLKVTKRFSQGLQFMAHYTWSKAMNYTDDYFVDSPRIAYGPDDYNRNHVFISNVLWELPFGKGKMFGANMGRAANAILGGWQLSTVTNWSGGLPWTPSYANCGSDKDTGPCRPNRVGSFATGVGSFDPINHQVTFFTPVNGGNALANLQSAGGWQRPGPGNFGTAGRNSMRGPRLFTSDMSLLKNFDLSERVKAQFRVDAFNVFNHPVLGFNTDQGNHCIDCGG